jgi:hypothetical protein
VIRAVKEEETKPNLWDTPGEVRAVIEAYVTYYDELRFYPASDYQTPAASAAGYLATASPLPNRTESVGSTHI